MINPCARSLQHMCSRNEDKGLRAWKSGIGDFFGVRIDTAQGDGTGNKKILPSTFVPGFVRIKPKLDPCSICRTSQPWLMGYQLMVDERIFA